MTTSNNEARAIFLEAIEQQSAQDRADFLDRACECDQELRFRVERLLTSHQLLGTFHDATSPGLVSLAHPVTEMPGDSIGPYKLLQQIGEGGMGVVFLAEQERPVKRRVALKIIKPGMDTREVMARFEAERQVLAMMDHPNIAKVFDAASTESGLPYFVMELVQGVPITEYCDQCNLTTNERLELFVAVCQAVQHAHQKGVIHRDIKPTNVLIANLDGKPSPKIIDFGVAKAIGQQLTEHTVMTAFAQMVGTPLYMSPEQAELSPFGVDTRTDIYSLGVLLYELLTSTTPFDKDRLRLASYDEMRRIIREEEPPRPSIRISTLAAECANTVAEHRRVDPRRLTQQVRGELEWIVMKCLDKDRNRRYETPNSLARDVERYLHDEPVQACPPSISYRLTKFIRRNKAGAAAVAVFFIGVLGLGISNFAIKRERDAKTTALARAQSVSDLLQEMLASSNPEQVKGSHYTVRELLDDFSAGLSDQLADQPEVEAAIRSVIGKSYSRLGVNDRAELHLKKALEQRRELFGADDERFADSLVDYAWGLSNQGRQKEAEKHVRQALLIYRQRHSDPSREVRALWPLQHFLIRQKRYSEAEQVANESLALAGSNPSSVFPDLPNIFHGLAEAKSSEEKFEEAEEFARRSVDLHRQLHGEHHPETAWGLLGLEKALIGQKKFAQAEKPLREALAIFREYYASDHYSIKILNGDLAKILSAKGDNEGVAALADEATDEEMRTDSPGNHIRMARLLLSKKPSDAQMKEAHRQFRRAIEGYTQVAVDYPEDLDRRVMALDGRALAVADCIAMPSFEKEVDRINRSLEEELPQLLAAFPNSTDCQWQVAMIYRDWALCLFSYKSYLPVAEHAFSGSAEILERLSVTAPTRTHVWSCLANTYAYLGDVKRRSAKHDEAETDFQQAMKIYDEHADKIAADIAKDPGHWINVQATLDRIRFSFYLIGTNRQDEAGEFIRKMNLNAERFSGSDDLSNIYYFLALLQLHMGDEAGYRATCKAMLALPNGNDEVSTFRKLWTCCLNNAAVDDPGLVLKRAEELVNNNSLDQPHSGLSLLGIAHYRAGQYEQAAKHLEESISTYPEHTLPGFDTINSQQLVLVMTEWQLGQRDQARRHFAKIQLEVDKELESPLIQFHRRATLEILDREATALIAQKDFDEAVENKTRTNSPTSAN